MNNHGIVGREITHGYSLKLHGQTKIQVATNTAGNLGCLNDPRDYAAITLDQAFKTDDHGRNAFSTSRGTLTVSWRFPNVERLRESIARDEDIDIRLVGYPYFDRKKGGPRMFYIDIIPTNELVYCLDRERLLEQSRQEVLR